MSISPLVSSILLKGVTGLASKTLSRFDDVKEASPSAKPVGQDDNLGLAAKEFGQLLRSYQDMLSDRIQAPYLDGAAENNRKALEEVSDALSQHLETLDIHAGMSGLMEQLEAGLPQFELEGQSLGSPFQEGIWALLGAQERALLEQVSRAEKGGEPVETGADELALRMKRQFMA
ncbi:MAG: hypothetical protein KUG83_08655 [Gammaproteobacteria bacterium]|nr:hypothetical protein [Gammaproteobacteria bacterium]